MVLPFAALLLCIAVLPLTLGDFWGKHYKKVVLGLGAVSVLYYLVALGGAMRILGVAWDYVSFIVFIGSLFVVSGGIHIRVKGGATPSANCRFLLVGAILANVMGTTGASMLLIRPWIRTNRYRFTNYHTAFFIFLISNVGGCLTPIGDPPLFLGYLKGVPFWWITARCLPAWGVAVCSLLALFYAIDRHTFMQAPRKVREAETGHETWKVEGLISVPFLLVILGAVFIKYPPGLREALMAGSAYGAYRLTPRPVHQANHFTFGPIQEVAWLFAGIFATMVPVLDFLELHAGGLGIREPIQFYWLSGALSSVLDNAPTYLTFAAAAFGLKHLSIERGADVARFLAQHGRYITAVSLGSVFFGAMTYIGNGPNLMVKSIVDHANMHTPHFFAYVFKHSMMMLLPVLFLVSLLFFSRWHIF